MDARFVTRLWCRTKNRLRADGYKLADSPAIDCTQSYLTEIANGLGGLYGNPGTGWCVRFPLVRQNGRPSRYSVWVCVLPDRKARRWAIALAGWKEA
jgi:hypothetical protein